jgi:hypothetical protein
MKDIKPEAANAHSIHMQMTAYARMDAQNGLLYPMNIMKDLANCWRGLPALREETPPNLKPLAIGFKKRHTI